MTVVRKMLTTLLAGTLACAAGTGCSSKPKPTNTLYDKWFDQMLETAQRFQRDCDPDALFVPFECMRDFEALEVPLRDLRADVEAANRADPARYRALPGFLDRTDRDRKEFVSRGCDLLGQADICKLEEGTVGGDLFDIAEEVGKKAS